jgi:hypothetical protein
VAARAALSTDDAPHRRAQPHRTAPMDSVATVVMHEAAPLIGRY